MTTISPDLQARNMRLSPHLMYICPECGKGYRSQPDWRSHLNQKHGYNKKTVEDFNFKRVSDRFHECQTCYKWVASEKHTISLIQYHRFMHLQYPKTYRCLHCREAYSRRRALNDHLEEVHQREIAMYEARVKNVKSQEKLPQESDNRLQQQQQQNQQQRHQEQHQQRRMQRHPIKNLNKKDDLIRKALLDSQIDLELEALDQVTKNPSELALDRSLSALQELMREDKSSKSHGTNQTSNKIKSPNENDMQRLCDDFFETVIDPITEIKQEEEVVTIEIDALNEDEVKMLSQSPSMPFKLLAPSPPPPPTKRKRTHLPHEQYEHELTNRMMERITYLCPECGTGFKTERDWRGHVFSQHDFDSIAETKFTMRSDMKTAKCLECFQIQPTLKSTDLLRHYFQHLPYRSYLKCDICGRTKTNTQKILNHIRHNHAIDLDEFYKNIDDEVNPTCRYCNKSFKAYDRLLRHLKECKNSEKTKQTAFDESYKAIMAHLDEAKERIKNALKELDEID